MTIGMIFLLCFWCIFTRILLGKKKDRGVKKEKDFLVFAIRETKKRDR